jgi:glycosyltransferase involved in cell wall biosynthesis
MKILSIVEATNVNAVAKLVLDFFVTAQELGQSREGFPTINGSIVTFDRAATTNDQPNDFVRAAHATGINLDIIPERRRFDLSVIPALKTITTKRASDIIVTNSVKSHFLVWRSRLWKMTPWVAFHHGYTTTDQKMRLYNRLDRWSLPKADAVVTVCDAFARELTEVVRVPREKIRVQHNSVRSPRAAATEDVRALRERLGISDERVILSVGRLSKEKGHADLTAAFLKLCQMNSELTCKLVIVGEGPEREALFAAARASRFGDRIIFTGQVQDVQPYYAIADVFALASHNEGSPNVLLEAMAARVPVVATRVGGVPEIVADGESAVLVSPQNPQAMATAINRVLNDPSLAHRLTSVASALITRNHAPEDYARSLVRVYTEVADERSRLR